MIQIYSNMMADQKVMSLKGMESRESLSSKGKFISLAVPSRVLLFSLLSIKQQVVTCMDME